MQLENQAYKQEAPNSTSRSNFWPCWWHSYHCQVFSIHERSYSDIL